MLSSVFISLALFSTALAAPTISLDKRAAPTYPVPDSIKNAVDLKASGLGTALQTLGDPSTANKVPAFCRALAQTSVYSLYQAEQVGGLYLPNAEAACLQVNPADPALTSAFKQYELQGRAAADKTALCTAFDALATDANRNKAVSYSFDLAKQCASTKLQLNQVSAGLGREYVEQGQGQSNYRPFCTDYAKLSADEQTLVTVAFGISVSECNKTPAQQLDDIAPGLSTALATYISSQKSFDSTVALCKITTSLTLTAPQKRVLVDNGLDITTLTCPTLDQQLDHIFNGLATAWKNWSGNKLDAGYISALCQIIARLSSDQISAAAAIGVNLSTVQCPAPTPTPTPTPARPTLSQTFLNRIASGLGDAYAAFRSTQDSKALCKITTTLNPTQRFLASAFINFNSFRCAAVSLQDQLNTILTGFGDVFVVEGEAECGQHGRSLQCRAPPLECAKGQCAETQRQCEHLWLPLTKK